MIRVFNSYQEQNNWIGRCSDIKLKGIIDLNHQKIDPINDAFGSGEVLKSNHLKVNYFLKYLKNKYGLIVSLDNDFINKICKYFDIKYVNFVIATYLSKG